MRCDCCDKILSTQECILKHGKTGQYLNTCVKCLTDLGIPIKDEYIDLDESNILIDEWNEDDFT